ncbi:hypothetical protein M3194_15830 [Paenibacillus glycanilyticus]|uniref:hypothetical protein n=1 Tax=Paenibacillus glycanilyticus TaxID=126569 RepID=UPI0020404C6A|nr:hypothetical protein [Paenibacillus glycanilyticus]MCM3628814.1 hypothetical protein [Paenibacillus glycanilyticus]
MKNMIKKILGAVIIFTLLFSTTVFASSEDQGYDSISPEQKEEIIQTMGKLTRLKLNELANTNSNLIADYSISNIGNVAETEEALSQHLKDLGARELTSTEVQSITGNEPQGVSPRIVVPGSNSNVKWYEIRYTHTRSGKSYDIQEVYAQGVGYNTNLFKSNDTLYILNTGKEQVNLAQNLFKVYAEKLIGAATSLIPVVNILPYEMFVNIPDGSQFIAMNSYYVTYRALTTAVFSYVKDAGKSDTYQSLSYVSSMYEMSATHMAAGIANEGTSQAKPVTAASKATDYSVYATDYASSSKAVDNYLNLSKGTSYAKNAVFTSPAGKTAKAEMLTPGLPSQIITS